MEKMYANNVDFPVKTQVRNSRRPEQGSTEEQCLVCNVELTMRGNHLCIAKCERYSKGRKRMLAITVYIVPWGNTQGEQSSPSWPDANI
jgi:hypothetical protein